MPYCPQKRATAHIEYFSNSEAGSSYLPKFAALRNVSMAYVLALHQVQAPALKCDAFLQAAPYLFNQDQDNVNDMSQAEESCSTFQEERSRMSSSREAIILRQFFAWRGVDRNGDQQFPIVPLNKLKDRPI